MAQGGWSPPAFITLTGGGIGWQTGAQSTDLVLIFRHRRALERLQVGKVTLGLDVAIDAGPVGRATPADREQQAEILAYSRGYGFFAGAAIDGVDVRIDIAANGRFYEVKNLGGIQLFAGQVSSVPPAASRLQQTLLRLSAGT
jgi:lipid-binding SYLF domain-containing protein